MRYILSPGSTVAVFHPTFLDGVDRSVYGVCCLFGLPQNELFPSFLDARVGRVIKKKIRPLGGLRVLMGEIFSVITFL